MPPISLDFLAMTFLGVEGSSDSFQYQLGIEVIEPRCLFAFRSTMKEGDLQTTFQ
jgi:hypothetical protein